MTTDPLGKAAWIISQLSGDAEMASGNKTLFHLWYGLVHGESVLRLVRAMAADMHTHAYSDQVQGKEEFAVQSGADTQIRDY